jgi:hypothetical protein
MSFIDDNDNGLTNDSDRLSKLLSSPEDGVEVEPQLPTTPRAKVTNQRNTVEPTPQESAPSEEVSAGEEEAENITPPASWDAEAKEKWAKLPPDVREIISHREAERERAINTKLQETAELRKQYETENSQTLAARQAYEQRLNHYAAQLEKTVPPEFQEIRSPFDLQRLAERDPAAAQRFMIWREQAAAVIGELGQLEQRKQHEAHQSQQKFLEGEAKALVEKWPEIADPVKGPTIRDEISGVLKSLGMSDAEIGSVSDHRILLAAKEIIAGQKALKAQSEAAKKVQAKPLPKVQSPGKGEGTGPQNGISKANLQKVARSGDQSSTAAALERLLSS